MRLPRAADAGEAGMGLTPLVDVIFLLLIFFVVATSFREHHIAIELPEALQAAVDEPRETLLVELSRDGEILVDGTLLTEEELDAALADHAPDVVALELRADGEVPHARVVRVLGSAQAHGLEEISIAVEAKRSDE